MPFMSLFIATESYNPVQTYGFKMLLDMVYSKKVYFWISIQFFFAKEQA